MANPARKSSPIRDLQSALMGVDVVSSITNDTCVGCKGPAKEFKTDAARKEFTLSGLCQKCQDGLFDNPELED